MNYARRLSWALLLSLFIPLMAEAATLSYGSVVTFNDTTALENAGVKIDSTHVLLAYQDSGAGKAAVTTVDGTTLTVGSEYQFCSSSCTNISVALLDSTHAFIAYETGNTGYGVIATLSETTISYGTAANFSTSVKSGTQVIAVAALDSTHVALNYLDRTGSFPAFTYISKAIAATVSGNSISYGSPTTLSANSAQYAAITAMDSTHFMVFYSDNNGTPHLIAASVSGTSMTFGSAITFSGYNSDPSISMIDSTHAVAVYRSTSGDNTYALVVTLAGTTVSAGTSQAVMAVSGYYPYAAALDSTHLIVIYRNNNAGGAPVYATHLTVASGVVTGDTASLALDVNLGNLNRSVIPLDSSSALIVAMEKAVVATTDTTAPGAPASFVATPSSNHVSLSWTNPVDSDFFSNTIRRGISGYPTSTSDGTGVASGVTGTSMSDTGLSDGPYYYSIFARDLRGNYSTAAHATATVDATPTAAPAGATATVNGRNIVITWTNPADSDFQGVTIMRSTTGYPADFDEGDVATTEETDGSFTQNNAPDGTYYYSLFALDSRGNVSTAAHVTATLATVSSSSSSSSEAPHQSGGGSRGSSTRMIVQSMEKKIQMMQSHPAAAEKSTVVKEVMSQELQKRACERVTKWFKDDAKMRGRVNERLLKRFGFTCS